MKVTNNSYNSRQVSSYIDNRLFEKLEAYREKEGINRSDAVEELIVKGLDSVARPKERTFFETQFDPPKPKPTLPDVPELDRLAEKVLSSSGQMTGVLGSTPHHLVRSALALYILELRQYIAKENTPQKIGEREFRNQTLSESGYDMYGNRLSS